MCGDSIMLKARWNRCFILSGVVDDIKIEPSARSENEKPLSNPVKSLDSIINK